MITITHSEEDCFWILTGIIRSFPRPFAVTGSVLNSDCDSVMRYEMTAFKAMLQQNLPAVHEKLKDYGLPVEFLVYKYLISRIEVFFRPLYMKILNLIYLGRHLYTEYVKK